MSPTSVFSIADVERDGDLDSIWMLRYPDSNNVVNEERYSAIGHSFVSNSREDNSAVQ
jgi:hypothetical protein